MTPTTAQSPPQPPGARSWRRGLLAFLALLAFGYGVWRFIAEVQAARNFTAAREALERGDLAEARTRLARCLTAWPASAETHFLAGQAARRAGDFPEAERLLTASKRLGWVHEAIDLEFLLMRVQGGDLDSVEDYLQDCLARDHPDSVLILEVLSRAYLRSFQLHDAAACLERWLEKQPTSVQAWLFKGDVALRLHNQLDAEVAYRKAAELAPDNDDVQMRYGNVLVSQARGAEAAALFERLTGRQPNNPGVRLGLARSRLALGQVAEARHLLADLLTERPNDVEVMGVLGQLELDEGRAQEAAKWLRQAVQKPPYEPELLFSYVRCLEQCDRGDEAKTWLDKLERAEDDLRKLHTVTRTITEKAPRDADLRWEAGRLLLRNGHDKEGLRWLSSALRLDPVHVKTHQTLTQYYDNKKMADLAAYHRRKSETPTSPHPTPK
jgi:predicted Zn-dependent protease